MGASISPILELNTFLTVDRVTCSSHNEVKIIKLMKQEKKFHVWNIQESSKVSGVSLSQCEVFVAFRHHQSVGNS
jgi:hypothetical protein